MPISDNVTNFAEILVEESIEASGLENTMDPDLLQDVVCIALNNLPPHYVRSTLDVKINLSAEDRHALMSSVDAAVMAAVEVVNSGRRQHARL